MTGPLAQQIAGLRDVVPAREEIELRIAQAEAVIEEPDEYPREYLSNARREIARCERLLVADAALSVIERHVQDMETALEDIAVGRWNVRPTTRFGLGLRIGSNISAPDYARGVLDDLHAALPAREKGTPPPPEPEVRKPPAIERRPF